MIWKNIYNWNHFALHLNLTQYCKNYTSIKKILLYEGHCQENEKTDWEKMSAKDISDKGLLHTKNS